MRSLDSPQFASLYVAVSLASGLPVDQYFVSIDRARRRLLTGETGLAVLDSIPPGKWIVYSNYLGADSVRRDTIQFSPGKQETLRVVLDHIRHGFVDTLTR